MADETLPHPWDLPNPWTGIPLVGELIDSIQEELKDVSESPPGGSSIALIIALGG